MPRFTFLMLVAGILATVVAPASVAGEPSAFERIGVEYESIRQSLLQDTIDGVAVAAGRIERDLAALEGNPGAEPAGTRNGTEGELRELLPGIRSATTRLREAVDIEQAREAFGDLSEAMVRYRRLVPDPGPVVVFCSMAQAVWLQPKGEIGNPYYGQSMARCGEVVSE